MSQWGAYGAVKVAHRNAAQVLHFYYPHTRLQALSTTRRIRVLASAVDAAGRGYLQVEPAAGLTVKAPKSQPLALPRRTANHHRITAWRLQRDGKGIDLREQANGHWHTVQAVGTKATFTDTAQELTVDEPGQTVTYRGAFVAQMAAGLIHAVNVVDLESYLRGVVPAEMPASWPRKALQAQAVASRSYAWYGVKHPKASWFDVDGDTRDQAYGGVAVENPRTDRAINVTAGRVLVDSPKHPIFAQFESSDGGWTVNGGQPYLPAKHDPYDGDVPNTEHAWTTSVPASSLESAYPAIGHLMNITITQRDGNGHWGGRVLGLTVNGTDGSVDLTGVDLQFALGLRSPWFRPIPTPSVPRSVAADVRHQVLTVDWKAPRSVKGAAAVTGYRVTVSPGRHHKTQPATKRHASFSNLAPGSYTVTVTATSDAGRSPAASVVVKAGHQ
jgi:SpoIID/LytB domain protein